MNPLREQRRRLTPAELRAVLARAQARVRTWFEGQLAQGALDLARVYKDHRDMFVDRIATVYDRYLREDPTLMRARMSPAAEELTRAINETVGRLTDELGLRMADASWRTLDATPAAVNRTVGRAMDIELPAIVPARMEVVQELTTRVVGGGTAYDRIFNVTAQLRDELAAGVRQGLLNGDTFDAVRDRTMRAFGVDRLPKPTKSAFGAVKVYRNEARHQWSMLMRALGRNAPEPILEAWWTTLDERTTPGCAARHGRAISEVGVPPRHTNCRCTVALLPMGTDLGAYKVEADAWLQAAGFTRRRASQMEAWAEAAAWDPSEHPRDEQGRFARIWQGRALKPFGQMSQEEMPETMGPPGEHVYHTTSIGNLDDIAAGGLEPQGPGYRDEQDTWPDGGTERREYFSTVPGGALKFSEPDHVLLRVTQPEKLRAEFKDQDYFVRKPVRPEDIEVQGIDGQWIPLAPVARELPSSKQSGIAWGHARLLPLREVTLESIEEDFDGWYRAVRWRLLPTVVRRGLRKDEWYRTPGQAMRHGSYDFVMLRSLDRKAIEVCSQQGWVPLQPHGGRWIETHRGYALDAVDAPPWSSQDERAALVVLEDGGVWAIKPKGLSFWALPGGHLKPGESHEDAAVREFTEETGIHVELVRKLGTLDTWWANTTVFLGRRSEHCGGTGQPTTPDEVDAVQLVPIAQLNAKDRHFLADTLPEMQEAAEFDPAEHPRAPAGGPAGGQFIGKDSRSTADRDFRPAVDVVDGRTIKWHRDIPGNVSNYASISASLGQDWEELDGVREVPLAAFEDTGKPSFYSATERGRVERLAKEIAVSKEIEPLIVVVDARGPYVLEGGHRFDALRLLKAKSFPAIVVVDTSAKVEESAFDPARTSSRTSG